MVSWFMSHHRALPGLSGGTSELLFLSCQPKCLSGRAGGVAPQEMAHPAPGRVWELPRVAPEPHPSTGTETSPAMAGPGRHGERSCGRSDPGRASPKPRGDSAASHQHTRLPSPPQNPIKWPWDTAPATHKCHLWTPNFPARNHPWEFSSFPLWRIPCWKHLDMETWKYGNTWGGFCCGTRKTNPEITQASFGDTLGTPQSGRGVKANPGVELPLSMEEIRFSRGFWRVLLDPGGFR